MSTSASGSGGHELTVANVIDETADARSIVLHKPREHRERFDYRPGQFLTFRIPSERTGHVARSYSLSSAPDIDDDLKVTVKRTADGYGSNWLCTNIEPGDTVTVSPPSGRFTPAHFDDDLLLFAAGSGITPVMSILKTALLRGERSVVLFYANRDRDSVIFGDELDTYHSQFTGRFAVRHWLDNMHGFPSPEQIAELAAEHRSSQIFLCGPSPFMKTVAAGLELSGIPRDQVHQEVFTSLSGSPFADPESPAGGATDAGEAVGTVEAVVHLGGRTYNFEWPRNRTLVDALLDREVDVPYSCRSGECGSCACTVLSGAVEMAPSDLLGPDDVADGFILGCQSRPDSNAIEIEF